jgi:sugar phosphate permease
MEISDLGRTVLRKAEMRLVPFAILLFVVSFIDRINAGFAAPALGKDLGITPSQFGFGAGIFFIGYLLFEVPSNMILQKVGARRWIGRIVISWGLITALHVFTAGATSFAWLRFFLGLAEAGFAPGLLYYFTLWFPSSHRGAIMSRYLTASAIAVIVGAPLSTSIFALNGVLGLAGWQWMFLVEGGLGVVLGIITLFYLTDNPNEAAWLNETERTWLTTTLDREPATHSAGVSGAVMAFRDARVWVLTFMFFTFGIASYGLIFWIATIVKQVPGLTLTGTGLVTSALWIVAIIVMVIVGKSSDHFRERHFHFAAAFVVGAIGLIASVSTADPIVATCFLGLAAAGMWSGLGVFWTMPQQIFKGSAAAACLALVNSIGNLGGFFGPYFMGLAKDYSGTFTTGLIGLAVVMILGAVASIGLKLTTGDSVQDRMSKAVG